MFLDFVCILCPGTCVLIHVGWRLHRMCFGKSLSCIIFLLRAEGSEYLHFLSPSVLEAAFLASHTWRSWSVESLSLQILSLWCKEGCLMPWISWPGSRDMADAISKQDRCCTSYAKVVCSSQLCFRHTAITGLKISILLYIIKTIWQLTSSRRVQWKFQAEEVPCKAMSRKKVSEQPPSSADQSQEICILLPLIQPKLKQQEWCPEPPALGSIYRKPEPKAVDLRHWWRCTQKPPLS